MKVRILQEPLRGTPGFKEMFLLHFFARHPELKAIEPERDAEDRAVCDITLQINGHEVDPLHFIARLEESWDDAVKQAAVELVEEKLGGIVSQLQDTVETTRKHAYRILGVEEPERW